MRKKFDRKQQTNASTHTHTNTHQSTHKHTRLEHTLTLLGTITIHAYPSRLPVWQGHLPELCAIYAKTHTHANAYVLQSLLVLLVVVVVAVIALVVVAFRWQTKDADSVRFFFIDAATFTEGARGGGDWVPCLLLSKMFFKSEIKNSWGKTQTKAVKRYLHFPLLCASLVIRYAIHLSLSSSRSIYRTYLRCLLLQAKLLLF